MVMDGQGGGLGTKIIKGLFKYTQEKLEISACGTNAVAKSSMMKAGANGENAIVYSSPKVGVPF